MPLPSADMLATAQRLTDAAYSLHDTLYARSKAERSALMESAQTEALAAVDAMDPDAETGSSKARIWYLRGKALASTPAGRASEQAERMLADAVKLDPTLNDAWNCLGECFWSRGEHETARYTFIGALSHGRTAPTLCHLSMLLRMMGRPVGASDALLQESVQLAKEAVRLDATSPRTWCGLGNAHLALYARASSSAEDLRMANRAFLQAAKAHGSTGTSDADADMHVNHGTVLALLDMFAEALPHFQQAHALDPFVGAKLKEQQTWEHVGRLSELVASRAGLKPKRLSALLAPLHVLPVGAPPLSNLQLGPNHGRQLHVAVIHVLPQDQMRCHVCAIVCDRDEHVVALSLYSYRGSILQVGHSIELFDPMLLRVEVAHPDTSQAGLCAGFHLLRVETPASQMKLHGSN